MAKHPKINNNLIMVSGDTIETHYFTNSTRAANFIGVCNTRINYSIAKQMPYIVENDIKYNIELVDGSEIPYKYINWD